MSDTLYRYKGPLTGVTFQDGREVMLFPDREVSLPAENGYVKTLLAMGRLTPITPEPPAKRGKLAAVPVEESPHDR